MFLLYVNDIGTGIISTVKLFADDSLIQDHQLRRGHTPATSGYIFSGLAGLTSG